MQETQSIQVTRFNWSEAEPLHGLICLPAILIVLTVGILIGQPGWGAMACGGAMGVGFGSFQRPIFHRYGPMLLAAIGISISSFIGAFFAINTPALVAVSVVWAFLYGLVNSQGAAASWVGVQCYVYLIISSAAPDSRGPLTGTIRQAAERGGATLAGALLELAIIVFLWRFVPRADANLTDPNFDPGKFTFRYLRSHITVGSIYFHFAIRMAFTSLIATIIYRNMHYANAYWIAMTAILIPKPEFFLTAERTILRLGGTILGAGVATIIAAMLRPNPWVLTALVLLYLWVSYIFMNVNYGVFTVAITGYIAFILAINRLPEKETMHHRIIATCLGGLLALIIHAVFHWIRKYWKVVPTAGELPLR